MSAAFPAPMPITKTPAGQKRKFVYVLIAQLLMIALYPYLDRPGWPMVIFRLLGSAAFSSAIYALSSTRLSWIVALVLAVPAVVLNSISAFRPEPRFIISTLLCTMPFLAFTLISFLHAVLTAKQVTSDTICGAMSVYLLIALTWGTIYLLLVTLQPGALRLNTLRHPDQMIDWGDCIFYSYVTLTSLGYGDIVPVTRQARSLSILEAVSGIMYVAVLVARLVGLYSAPNRQAP